MHFSQRKELCNLHPEVCTQGRRRGQEEAAALRRGQSKLLSRKKKIQTKTPDARARAPPPGPLPSLGPCTPAACLPPAASKSQSCLEPLRRSANEMKGSAKALEAREGLNLWNCLAFGRRRDTDLHMANGRRCWRRDRDPLRANETGRRGKHMALRVLLDAGVGQEGCPLKEPRVHRLIV